MTYSQYLMKQRANDKAASNSNLFPEKEICNYRLKLQCRQSKCDFELKGDKGLHWLVKVYIVYIGSSLEG